jgi:hypothetical protein
MPEMRTADGRTVAAFCAIVLGSWGCSSAPAPKSPMNMEGVVELPSPKVQQVATYRCSIDLQTGRREVKMDRRSGPDEEAVWNNLSRRIKNADRTYEVSVEETDKNAKGRSDWAFVTVLETETGTGKLLRKIPVYEFWGNHDRQTPRALMIKNGRLQFFIQFWTAE